MIAMIVAENHYAQQAWLHLEAGDTATAKTWANMGRQSARARRDDRAVNPCVLLLALALLSIGDTTNGKSWLRTALRGADHCRDYLGAGVSLVCLALVSAERFVLLERADVHFERAMRSLAQAGDVARWRRVKALRGRVVNDAESLLPPCVLCLEYAG